MVAYSKFAKLSVPCKDYAHKHIGSCAESHAKLLFVSIQECLRIYITVYTLALLMKGRLPKKADIKKMLVAVIQSSAFLSMCAFNFSFFLCTLRNSLGYFNFLTLSFVPSFLSSLVAILIERPSRRSMLSLYVANVATETLWRMAVARRMINPIPHGEVLIFGGSMAILLCYFRTGQHKSDNGKNDPLFDLLRFVVGPYEEKGFIEKQTNQYTFYRQQMRSITAEEPSTSSLTRSYSASSSTDTSRHRARTKFTFYSTLMQAVKAYKRIIYRIKCVNKHNSCPHPFSCVYYIISGGIKQFSVGFCLQLVLKLLLNAKRIVKRPATLKSVLINRKILQLGLFLGGFSSIYRLISCLLRWITGRDNELFAIPAGLIASTSFIYYPDNTVALYVMWKMIQRTYQLLVKNGVAIDMPGFTELLFSVCTAVLFHAALFEPTNLRPSYWRFLHAVSGGRVEIMDRTLLDVYGLESQKLFLQVMARGNFKTPTS